MIDSFSLLASHGLILIALWRLLSRPDLDREPADAGRNDPGDPGGESGKARGDA